MTVAPNVADEIRSLGHEDLQEKDLDKWKLRRSADDCAKFLNFGYFSHVDPTRLTLLASLGKKENKTWSSRG